MDEQPTEKELRVKSIVAFCLAIVSTQFLIFSTLFRMTFTSIFTFTEDGLSAEVIWYAIHFGTILTMDILALYFVNEGKALGLTTYSGLRKAAYIISIITIVICSFVLLTVTIIYLMTN